MYMQVQAVLRNDMEWHDRHTAAGLKVATNFIMVYIGFLSPDRSQ